MMNFFRKALKKIKLFVLYWTRIVFVKNNFKVSFFNKIRMNVCGGFLADQYVLYDLKNRSRKEYLSEFDWYRSRYINEPFDFAFNNKVICSEILKQYIRTPENYFIKNKGIVLDFDNGVRDYESIYKELIKRGHLVLKPFALGKGNGVHVLEAVSGKIYIDGKAYEKCEFITFLKSRKDYIVCEFMVQHEYARKLYGETVNTIRLITMRDIYTHEFKVFFAVQRIGRKTTVPVDNGSKGGLVSKIDLETGRLSKARCLHDLNEYEIHPDSGGRIEGVMVPRWEQVKGNILKICKRVPYMDFIAWDLLVMNDDICMIEANTSSGVNILQLWGGQRQGELGEFFVKYKVIKS